MRRMYSEQELTKIVKEVAEAYIDELIEDGEFDQKIEDYIDEYLVEHPVDPTAITGLDIAPKDVTASGNITGASIIENMAGYSSTLTPITGLTIENIYSGICKNGNKITFVHYFKATKTDDLSGTKFPFTDTIPSAVGSKLVPELVGQYYWLAVDKVNAFAEYNDAVEITSIVDKVSNTSIKFGFHRVDLLELNKSYNIRLEFTFLLSENLIS